MEPSEKPLGELCLDLANTLRWHASDHPLETLTGYADLLSWARDKGALSPGEAGALLELSRADEAASRKVYARAIELREAIYGIVVDQLRHRNSRDEFLKPINRELELAHRHLQLAQAGQSFQWTWSGEQLDLPLWQVARSAAELLTSPELLARLGQCADDRGCGWLFIDWSKNHSRRWCDINDCGNRAKQRRHYLKARTASGDSSE